MLSPSKKAHSGKTKKELIGELERAESLLNAKANKNAGRAGGASMDAAESRLNDFFEFTDRRFFECDSELLLTYASPQPIAPTVQIPLPAHDESLSRYLAGCLPLAAGGFGSDSADILGLLDKRNPLRDFRFQMPGQTIPDQIFSASAKPFADADGRFQGYRGYINAVMPDSPSDDAPAPDQSLQDTIESIPLAIAKFGPDDSLVACNQRYKELLSLPPELLSPGVQYEQIVRACLDQGLYVDAAGKEEEFLRERMEARNNPGQPTVFHIRQNQWLEIREEKSKDGGTICVGTDITGQRQSGDDLRYQKQMMEAVLDAMPSDVWVKDREGRYLLVNNALAKRFDLNASEFLGKTSSEIGHLDEQEVRWFAELNERVFSSGQGIEIPERRIPLPDGGSIVQHTAQIPLRDETGKIEAVLGVSRDITARKRAEEELRESQSLMAGILDIANDAIISIDENQIITLYNKGAERIFGFTAEEAIGQHLDMLLPDHVRQIHKSHMEKFAGAAQPSRRMSERAEVFGQRKGGEEFPAEASISKLDLAGGMIYTVMLRDITQRKLIEESLRSSRRLLQTVFNTIPHPILVKDADSRHVMANDAACEFHGLPPEEILNKTTGELTHLRAENIRAAMEADARVFSTGDMVTEQELRQRSDGRVIDLQTIRAPLRGDEGAIVGLVLVSVDITERVEAERKAKEAHERLADAVENLPQGFALFDPEDRLVLWNERFSDANADVRDVIKPGVKFEEILREIASRCQRQSVKARGAGWLEERLALHKNPRGSREMQGYDGGWFLVSERKTREGGVTGVWTDIGEHKQAEQALRASQRLLQTVFDAIPHYIIVKNMEGRYLAINKATSEFQGLEQGQVIGKHPMELEQIIAGDRDESMRADEQFLASGQRIYQSEYKRTSHDGRQMILQSVRSLLHDDEGNPEGWVMVSMDITEQREAEQMARQSHERLMDAVESISHGFVLYDPQDKLVLWNEKFAEINNDVREFLVPGTPFETIVRNSVKRGRMPESGLSPEKWIQERLKYHNNPKGSIERLGSDGNWYLAAERRTREGGTAGVWTDITERKRVEEALRAREEQLQLFITHAPVAVAMFDRDMRYIVHSRRWVEDFQLEMKELIGLSQYDIFPETPKHWIEAYQRCLAGAVEVCDEDSVRRADGSLWWLRWEIHPWRDARGDISGIVAFIEVINDRKKTEAQLIRSQRMEAVGQLTGGVAHEFNNLLHIIQSYAFLLGEQATGSPKTLDLIRPIENASNRGRDLVKRLLAFSRRQLLQPKTMDLGEVALDLIELIRPPLGESIDLVTVTSDALWPILVDRGELENALLNLALNARDAMPKGGKLTITTQNYSAPENEHAGRSELSPREYVRLAVSDTGSGIALEIQERVFEPFFTTKGLAEHSGLGLSMVHGFVNQSGGYVNIDSTANRGTTVSLYLPRAAE